MGDLSTLSTEELQRRLREKTQPGLGAGPGRLDKFSGKELQKRLEQLKILKGKSTLDKAIEFVAGTDELDLPELGPALATRTGNRGRPDPRSGGAATPDTPEALTRRAQLINAVGIPRDIQGKMDAIKATEPAARFASDPGSGAIIAILPDGNFFINASGFSMADVRDVGLEAVFEAPFLLPAARIGAWALGGGRGWKATGRVLGAGTGAATGSIARDIAAQGVGSETPIDTLNAVIAGVTVGTFEGGMPLAVDLLKKVTGRATRGGKLAAGDADKLRRAGIDPETATPEFIKEFRNRIGKVEGGTQAAITEAQAASLPVPVRLSRGQATDDPGLLAAETQLRSQGRSQGDNPLLDLQDATQGVRGDPTRPGTLLANREAIQTKMGGGVRHAVDPESGAAIVLDQVQRKSKQGRKLEKRAYEKAKKSGDVLGESGKAFKPSFTQPAVVDMNMAVDDGLASELLSRHTLPPRATEALRQLDEFAEGGLAEINAMEKWLQGVNKTIRDTVGDDKTAAIVMKREYQLMREQALDEALFEGNEEAIKDWVKAIGISKARNIMFEGRDLVARLVKKTPDGFVVQPDDAVEAIFGAGKFGSQQNIARNFKNLRKVLGKDSDEWRTVRESAFLRLFKTQNVNEGFSAAKFAKELDVLLNRRKALKVLFTTEEVALFRQFKKVALVAERRPDIKGNANPSGTGIANWVNRLVPKFGVLGQGAAAGVSWAFSRFIPAIRKGRAITATEGLQRAGPPPGQFGAAGLVLPPRTGEPDEQPPMFEGQR